MNITIKILSPQNVNDFKKIRLSALLQAPEMFGSTYTTEVTHQDIYFKNCLLNSIAFAAYHDKDIIGIAVLVRESAIRIAHKAHLASVFIEPKFQQKGIAHILLNTVIKHARAQRIEQILLTVVEDNMIAINLYKKLGFQIYGTEINALKDQDKYTNEILMKLFLTKNL
ncbi:GNAT family N-acetyltransferase [Acinetobacter equi]|uniref:GCN5 family acetyltransferase n=1 Tax=Acinetobacter equi TaxID=1324350 RepID=A0A0N9V7Q9_9GAMM|nr:GNAT family N-acetyltransferase [Acinetobacter equi]ALH95228.1 GCN5 family acetyltransferase [Acinetobacter equi]